jgi:hypothetical protein
MDWEIGFGLVLAGIGAAVGFAFLILGLPGTWLFWVAALLFAWWSGFVWIGGWAVLALFLLAVAGEVLEFALGVSAAARARPSWRVVLCTLIGGTAGALLGAPLWFGLGALPGALLGSFLGGALGAAWEGAGVQDIWNTGLAAMRGRWRGFVAKLLTLCTMVGVFVVALFW